MYRSPLICVYAVSELQIRFVKWTSFASICLISSPNPMFDHLLESSRWDDSNKWSNIGFGEEICIKEIKICTLSGALNILLINMIYCLSSCYYNTLHVWHISEHLKNEIIESLMNNGAFCSWGFNFDVNIDNVCL